MLTRFKRLWHAAPLATIILVVALAAAAVFGVRTLQFYRFAHDPARIEEPVADWMTPGFIGHSYRIPRDEVMFALHLPDPPPERRMTLRELADYRGVPVETVMEEARALIAAHQPPAHKDAPPK